MESQSYTKNKTGLVVRYILSSVELKNSIKNKKLIYVDTIKYTLKHFKLSTKGKKKEVTKRLVDYYSLLETYKPIMHLIIALQKKYKNRYSKSNCKKDIVYTNAEDFYTLESLTDIEHHYLFSFKDTKGFNYGFDIRSFKKLVDSGGINPYNRESIPLYAIENMNAQLNNLKQNNISIDTDADILTKEQQFKAIVISIFQKMDTLNVTAGGTRIEWFLNLSFVQLKNFYRVLEDIWNYRAELTYDKKCEIVPNNDTFKYPVSHILAYNPNKKRQLQLIILKEIDTLISSSPDINNRNTGCYYVLIAFTEVSYECAQDMPWLIQY
jgi:hypothetical protein